MTADELERACRRHEVVFDAHGMPLRCACDSDLALDIVRRSVGAFLVERNRDNSASATDIIVGTTSASVEAASLLDPGTESERLLLVDYPSGADRGWSQRRGNWTIVVSGTAVRYAINHLRRKVIVTSKPNEHLVVALVRLLRRILDPAMLARGASRAHAAALRLGGGGVMAFAGSAGAGKTTLLLGLTKVFGAQLLAFDKLFLWPSKGDVYCAGVPGALGVGIGTASHLSLFADHFAGEQSLSNPPLSQPTRPSDKARVSVTALTPDFCMAKGSHPLRSVIFPRFAQGSVLSVFSLPTVEGVRRLTQQSFGAQLSPYEQDWLRLKPAQMPRLDAPGTLGIYTALHRQIGYWEVRFGNHAPEQILASLSAASGCEL